MNGSGSGTMSRGICAEANQTVQETGSKANRTPIPREIDVDDMKANTQEFAF